MATRKSKRRRAGQSRAGQSRATRAKTTRSTTAQSQSRSRQSRGGQSRNDVIALLKRDHDNVKKLFREFEAARRGERKAEIARTICRELTVHSTCEEELVYPAAAEVLRNRGIVYEAEIEHAAARDLIEQIETAAPGDERFDAMVHVLAEYVRHHIKEEEGEFFPQLRTSRLDLEEIGSSLQLRKSELEAGERMTAPAAAPGYEDDTEEAEEPRHGRRNDYEGGRTPLHGSRRRARA